MDGGSDNVSEAYEHLARVHLGRPRLATPIDIRKLKNAEGTFFELDGEADDHIFDEDVNGGFDDEFVLNFHDLNDSGWPNMRRNCPDHFQLDFSRLESFDEVEQEMTPVNDSGTVKKTVVRSGSGKKIPERSKIFLHYVALFENSFEPYDSTLARRQPYVVDLRTEGVIPGFNLALKTMEVSEVARFIIYPEMAYGKLGCPPRVPKDAKVMFVAEMLQCIEESILNTVPYMTSDERATLPFKEILEACDKLRTDGNGYYSIEKNYRSAIRKYRKAIKMLEDYPLVTENDDTARSEFLSTLYSNLAQSYLKINNQRSGPQACAACKIGLKYVSGEKSVKLLYRFAQAKLLLGDFHAADNLNKQALKLKPDDYLLQELERKIYEKKKQEENSNNSMWRGMFSRRNEQETEPEVSSHTDTRAEERSD